ncbi:hypothetical protein DL96DRAFT_1626142 [Flagelloscypha sp. PMI_526]|nr:hypothetical protein DL96DRAFT_1626142 [Flagelloscypha sp. PMI_526]
METSKKDDEDCIGALYLNGCAAELPVELVEDILGFAAINAPADRRIEFLTLSKYTYNSLFHQVYGAVRLPPITSKATATSQHSFASFCAWVNSKPRKLQQTIKALRLQLDKAGKDEVALWMHLLDNLSGLEIFDLYCFDWTDECMASVWNLIFQLPKLKNVRLDWHFNVLSIPALPQAKLCLLQTVTHLSIVPELRLEFLRRFTALTHLAIFNPRIGYKQQDIFDIDAGLPNLHILVLILDVFEIELWKFDNTERIVGVTGMQGAIAPEFQSAGDESGTIWKRGEEAIARRLGTTT